MNPTERTADSGRGGYMVRESPKHCRHMEFYGQNINFVTHSCPKADPCKTGFIVPKMQCRECWDSDMKYRMENYRKPGKKIID